MTIASAVGIPRPTETELPAHAGVPKRQLTPEGETAPSLCSGWRLRLLLAAKLTLAISLLGWLVGSGRLELGKLLAIPRSADLVVFLAVVLLSLVVPAVRWWWLLRLQDLQVPLGRVLALTWVGYFTGLLLPGAASGDLAKGYLILCGRTRGRTRALSTVLADRVIGLYGLLFLGGLSGLWLAARGQASGRGLTMAGVAVLLLLAMTVAGTTLLFAPSRRVLLRVLPLSWRLPLLQSLDCYVRRKRGLLGCFGLSVLSSMLTLIALALSVRLLGEVASWPAAFLAGPLVILANCLPLAPGGLGVAETVSHGLHASLGTGCGAEMMALLRIGSALLSLPGLVVTVAAPASAGRGDPCACLLNSQEGEAVPLHEAG